MASLKLVDQITYLGSNISSLIKIVVSILIGKAWNSIVLLAGLGDDDDDDDDDEEQLVLVAYA